LTDPVPEDGDSGNPKDSGSSDDPGGRGGPEEKGNREGSEGSSGSPSEGKWMALLLKQAGPYMEAGYTMTGALLGLGLLGYFLDSRMSTSPACLLVGLGLGLAVGFYGVAKVTFKR
jgi:hypothetical protein